MNDNNYNPNEIESNGIKNGNAQAYLILFLTNKKLSL